MRIHRTLAASGAVGKQGLSAVDSERIVDAAIDGLIECTAAAFNFCAHSAMASHVCNQNVLQEAGLTEAIGRTALSDGVRGLARREAAERAGPGA